MDNDIFDIISYSNTFKGKFNLLKNLHPFIYKIYLAKNYSIGVELECINKDFKKILDNKYILNWPLKDEASVTDGVEINSKIMHYDKKSLKELLFICNFLNNYDFFVNDECSTHIHIGFDVFKNEKELMHLYEIFANNENIFFNLANEKGNIFRTYYENYSRSINNELEYAINLNRFSRCNNLYDFVKVLKNVQNDRYTSINIFNAFDKIKNTIEFRISNGEIKYDEILLNIILYLKLVDTSLKYKKIDDKLYQTICDIKVPEKERASLLINLLFNENNDLIFKFNERYEENKSINKDIALIKKIKFKR